jgi:hypothetical protein
MTLNDLGPQALVWWNICYQQHQFMVRGLGEMSSNEDERKDTTTTVCSPEIFLEHKKETETTSIFQNAAGLDKSWLVGLID